MLAAADVTPAEAPSGAASAIRVTGLSKCYQIYAAPAQRLLQFVVPRLRRWLGLSPRNHYREFWALHGVDLEVMRGQTVGIIGRNGSGKSTLLQIICGTLYPTNGEVQVQGRVAALLELGSGFNPEFTGRENVFFNAGVLGQAEHVTRERFAAIEAFADIGAFIDQPVKTYSSGMLVRLAFAVIAHVDADILVIDEALAVGDAFFTQKCMRFLREFMQTGTVLFVSHDTNAVKNLCNHAIWLDQGRVRMQGTPKAVSEAYLREFYAQQGQGADPVEVVEAPETEVLGDQRLPFLNASNLRNDLQVFPHDPQAASFGTGQARITAVQLCDAAGQALAWAVGGEAVRLRIVVRAHQALTQPIVGFVVKDRLGQVLFGENTYLNYQLNPVRCEAGEELVAEFAFWMPRMPVGDYTVTASIAEGTQQDHVQHHWVFDALAFRSESSSASAGLVGLPMQDVRLAVRHMTGEEP
ncbi:ABC transporter ATP-binding protein [Comamonas serinivorans]|uniref:ABC transporter ATP-binding protein n=1 Tax=Comamonas serinivorans TaxID=1082851 RepID=A0A1Y0EU35_9BURK|nr:ABC transporter ATP-binding protein [Comamonas serinivorans]ARU06961.1 ABC transporter ATP-binding protein [Comamonas serinivorans]